MDIDTGAALLAVGLSAAWLLRVALRSIGLLLASSRGPAARSCGGCGGGCKGSAPARPGVRTLIDLERIPARR